MSDLVVNSRYRFCCDHTIEANNKGAANIAVAQADLCLSCSHEPHHKKTCLGFQTRSSNLALQTQKLAKDLKFWIYEVEGLYWLCG